MGVFFSSVSTEFRMVPALLLTLLVILPSPHISQTPTFSCKNVDIDPKITCRVKLNKQTCAIGGTIAFVGLPQGTHASYTDSNPSCAALKVTGFIGRKKCGSQNVALLQNRTFFEVESDARTIVTSQKKYQDKISLTISLV